MANVERESTTSPGSKDKCVGEWIVEPNLNRLKNADVVRKLEPRAMQVLVSLMRATPNPVATNELLKLHWPAGVSGQRKVAKRISQIRAVLEDTAKEPAYIETISKRGYRIVANVQAVDKCGNHLPIDSDVEMARWILQECQHASSSSSAVAPEALSAFEAALSLVGVQDYSDRWLAEAISGLEKTVAIDANYANAWSFLALLNIVSAVWHNPEHMKTAQLAANRAMAIDDSLELSQVAAGYISLMLDWDIPAAQEHFEKAYKIAPDDSTVLQGFNLLLRIRGDLDKAASLTDRLHTISHHDVRYLSEQIKNLYEAHLYEEAIQAAEAVRAMIPGYADFSEAAALAKLGLFFESYKTRKRAYRLMGERAETSLKVLEQGWSDGGFEKASSALSEYQLTVRKSTNGLAPQEFAVCHSNPERVIEHLAVDVDYRRPWLIGLLHNPMFDELRTRAEYRDLLQRMNINVEHGSIAQQAEVARVRVFQGQAPVALPILRNIIDKHPDDPRYGRWVESLAWAHFAVSDFRACLNILEGGITLQKSAHSKAFSLLLKAASYSNMGKQTDAYTAINSAYDAWPGSLDIERDLKPLFYGRSVEVRDSYLNGIKRCMGVPS